MSKGWWAAAVLLTGSLAVAGAVRHSPEGAGDTSTLAGRFAPPRGFSRVPVEEGSFGAWLRALPLQPGRAQVHLYNGALKENQDAHVAVVKLDVGDRDLQQCADAVIRLRAEYLRQAKREQELCFRLTSGDAVPWSRWKTGERVVVKRRVEWVRSAPDDSYASFRRWLDLVFTYAGTASLARDLKRISLRELRPGDVFVQGGFPGHAVLVLDVATAPDGRQVMMLGQSYTPAQEFEVLRNPGVPGAAWMPVGGTPELITPEWTFQWDMLRRFPENACAE